MSMRPIGPAAIHDVDSMAEWALRWVGECGWCDHRSLQAVSDEMGDNMVGACPDHLENLDVILQMWRNLRERSRQDRPS